MAGIVNSETTMMQCRNCRAACDEQANFCSRCGLRLKGIGTGAVPAIPTTPHPKSYRSWWRRSVVIVGMVIVALLLLNGSFLAVVSIRNTTSAHGKAATRVSPGGEAWFYDLHGHSDGFALHLSGLPLLPTDTVYVGWLLNGHRPDQVLTTGVLTRNSDGSSNFLSEQSTTFNTTQQDLRLLFTQVLVTREHSGIPLQHPQGQPIVSGSITQGAVNALLPLFVSTPYTPGKIALLAGLRMQLDELVRWVSNLRDSRHTQDLSGMRADLLRIIYIIEGKRGTYVRALHVLSLPNIQNEGDGFGLLSSTSPCQLQQSCGYLDALRLTLQSLANAHYIASSTLQSLLIMLDTMQQLTQQIQQQVIALLPHLTLNSATNRAINGLTTLSSALQQGRDLDGDGRIDFVPGEAAAAQFFAYVQYVGAIPLSPAM